MASPTDREFSENFRKLVNGIIAEGQRKDEKVAGKKKEILQGLDKFPKTDYVNRVKSLEEEQKLLSDEKTDYKIRKESGVEGGLFYIQKYFSEIEKHLSTLIIEYKSRLPKELDKRAEPPTMHYSPYQIETSKLYLELRNRQWQQYGRFIEDIYRALRDIHYYKGITSYVYDGTADMKEKIDTYTQSYVNHRPAKDEFPIPWDYVGGTKKGYNYIVCMDEICPVTKKDDYKCFCLLFALQFSLTEITECKAFLNYHLESNFSNNRAEYEEFLEAICRQYDFLSAKHAPFVREVFYKSSNQKTDVTEKEPITGKDTPQSLKEVFTTAEWKKYIDALYKVDNPVIDNSYRFIGSPQKHKGVICSWIKELQFKGIIHKKYSRQQLVSLLNKEIKDLNIGKDGRLLDAPSDLYIQEYKDSLLKLTDLLP